LTNDNFLTVLKKELIQFEKAISTNEKEWIIKGFIDIYKNIYSISIDTKIVSKVLELLLFPLLKAFAQKNNLSTELSPQQNFYPDISFIDKKSKRIFALDIKTTYRNGKDSVNGMTLGAFTGYFRKRDSAKNTRFPYNKYSGHFVLGVIYTQCSTIIDERKRYTLADLNKIPSVIKDFQFFIQPKYKIASSRPGSGNTKNIGSVTHIAQLISGAGPFSVLGEEIFDDYWMYYLTTDMAKALEIERPYTNIKEYQEYKKRGSKILKKHGKYIRNLKDDSISKEEEEE